jgi:hypothetical protein
MTTDQEQPRLGYVIFHEAWYYDACRVTGSREFEVDLGMNYRTGGCEWECVIRWHDLGGRLIPRLEMFQDSWQAFNNSGFKRLVEWLAAHGKDNDNDGPTVDEVHAYLRDSRMWADDTHRAA